MSTQQERNLREQELFAPQELGYEVEWKTDYHVRINWLMDIYPVNNKFHDLRTNTRGYVTPNITEFIKNNVGLNERRK